MRASDLLGAGFDDNGRRGRIVELLAVEDEHGRLRVERLLIAPKRHFRLFGYERPGIQGPWVIEMFARLVNRGTHEVPYDSAKRRA